MEFGKFVDEDIVVPFLRAPKLTVICNGLQVSPMWTLESTEHSDTEKGLCKFIYRHEIRHRFISGYCDTFL